MDYKFPSENKITELTRRDIVDFIMLEGVNWAGRFEEPDFLKRIYNLEEMKSTDGRFRNAYGDIFQHRINNEDWDNDWVFYDARFDLMNGQDESFLRFLCEMLHPAVRSNVDEVMNICSGLNSFLKHDGFQLVEVKRMSGKPVFEGREVGTIENPVLQTANDCLTQIDDSYLSQQISRMKKAIDDDPGLAIGTAKELTETISKTIIKMRTGECPNDQKLHQLVRQVAEMLSLTPEGIPDEAKAAKIIKKVLGSLSSITEGMAELRNTYGTGHGKHAGVKGLGPRHARLVVGMASTLAIFLWDTHQEKADS